MSNNKSPKTDRLIRYLNLKDSKKATSIELYDLGYNRQNLNTLKNKGLIKTKLTKNRIEKRRSYLIVMLTKEGIKK